MKRKYAHRPLRPEVQAFGGILRRLRTEAGHPSARDFFIEAGGRAFFGCTYKQYLNVENGQSAPGPETLEKIATALGVWFNDAQAREVFLAYLRITLRSRKLVDMIVRTLSLPSGGSVPLRQAIQKDFQTRRYRVTEEQSRAMYASYAHYWVSTVFCTDNGDWTKEELAKLLSLDVKSVRTALRDLARCGFLTIGKDGERYRCRVAGKIFVMPNKQAHLKSPEAVGSQWMLEKMAQKSGVEEMFHGNFTRASAAALKQYYPELAQAVAGSDVYSTSAKGEDTAMYFIEARVRRLFPF